MRFRGAGKVSAVLWEMIGGSIPWMGGTRTIIVTAQLHRSYDVLGVPVGDLMRRAVWVWWHG